MGTESSRLAESHSSMSPGSMLLTFLIADVRGYTRFTVEQGDEAAARLADRFATLCEEILGQHDGRVIELRGDEALAVFPSARNALRAAVALQVTFRDAVARDPSLPLRVGIGLDAGEAIPVKGGYRGGALNLAARLCSIAGAGEVFASETVVGLARKTDGIGFVDRGEVALKGLISRVRVIQIAPEGELPDELPPLQPILITHPNNLPDEPTPFIGREQEIDRIVGMLRDPHIRMVTLTGPGGTGKTRLALQVGNTLLHDFRGGVFFVNLAPLVDPALVPAAIAEVLGIKEEAETDLVVTVADWLKDKHLLLVLDNHEHLLDAASVSASLVDQCRELHVLITSRIPLHLAREHEYAVPPLSVPDPQHLPDLGTLSQYEAVALFIDRARAVKADFQVTNENAPAVAEICHRLDGLPLAIELAAARVKLFPPRALLQRLSSRLKLLTGGAKDRPTRQQTLRGAIDWSYSLLTEEEQLLFARLSVFAGGCSLEAAEAVCSADGSVDVLEGIASLVDKSLIRQEGEEEARFSFLETIREYASEKLEAAGTAVNARDEHAAYYVLFAEEAHSLIFGEQRTTWIKRLEMEHDNLRRALGWTIESGQAELALRLAAALWHFWEPLGHIREGGRWLEAALAIDGPVDPAIRLKAVTEAGGAAWMRGDPDQAECWWNESLARYREEGDVSNVAWTIMRLGIAALDRGDADAGLRLHEEALARFRQLGETMGVAACLTNLGDFWRLADDPERAAATCNEALALSRELGSEYYVVANLRTLACIDSEQGRYDKASQQMQRSLRYLRGIEERVDVLAVLVDLMVLAARTGDAKRAGRLAYAVAGLRETMGIPLAPQQQEVSEWALGWIRERLDEEDRERLAVQGQAMSFEDTVAYALGESE